MPLPNEDRHCVCDFYEASPCVSHRHQYKWHPAMHLMLLWLNWQSCGIDFLLHIYVRFWCAFFVHFIFCQWYFQLFACNYLTQTTWTCLCPPDSLHCKFMSEDNKDRELESLLSNLTSNTHKDTLPDVLCCNVQVEMPLQVLQVINGPTISDANFYKQWLWPFKMSKMFIHSSG